jgi:hypothetical protein
MITVITPTHEPRWLLETAASLIAQEYRGEFEWLVVPNSGCEVVALPGFARVLPYPGPAANVGAIKAYACQHAKGEKIVELDHDDLLTPNALHRIDEALDQADFVYSDFAEFRDGSWEPCTYDAAYGWRYRDEVHCGHVVKVAEAFDPSAHSLSRIEYAPNHVRAWRTDSYWKIGGHDPSLKVADDYDLVCRFYLGGIIRRIPECLYLYRVHEGNSCRLRNAEVQEAMLGQRDRYLHQLVERWAALRELPKLNICCGSDQPAGWINVDSRPAAPIRADLEKTWPWPDNSIGVIRAMDALEHLADPVHTMTEIYRVLVPGGWLLTSTPSTDGRGAWQDPTHRSFWNANSWWYWTSSRYADYVGHDAEFQLVRLWEGYPTAWHDTNRIWYVNADLVALKGDYRAPGLVEI